MSDERTVSLISRWFARPDRFHEVLPALKSLAEQVQANEPDTLTYFVHIPYDGEAPLQAMPPADPCSILFFETYRDADAFLRHVNGPVFKGFVKQYGPLFVGTAGTPYTTVDFLFRHAGFTRQQGDVAKSEMAVPNTANDHPSVMFEIIAKDQQAISDFYARVFGWHFQTGTGGFQYIHFPGTEPPLLGGIGQTNSEPGFEPGHNFYLRVDDLQATIDRSVAAGGAALMPPTDIDGYSFAMIRDPEGNPVGLIAPFSG